MDNTEELKAAIKEAEQSNKAPKPSNTKTKAEMPSDEQTDVPKTKTDIVKATQQNKVSVLASLASKLDINPAKLMETLKRTAFKDCRTDEEFVSMCIVANTYGLNPITNEIYAFPSRKGIVPMVGYDGWQKLANNHPMYDGVEFMEADDGSWCECIIWRKDRQHPTRVREYLAECKMATMPWEKFPRRMLRNKAFNQCARAAFSFSGISDPDECERIKMCQEEEEARKGGQAFNRKATPVRAVASRSPFDDSESPAPEANQEVE